VELPGVASVTGGSAGLKVLFLSAEVAPFAKVGGLADVAGSLPRALRALGVDARVMMPSYKMVEANPAYNVQVELPAFEVQVGPDWKQTAYLKSTSHAEVPVYLLGTDRWFCESISSQTVYLPGSDQHLFFAAGVLAACKKLGWIPDVIHCNDWHTGFVPVIMREKDQKFWDNTASVFTIHNLAYQGEFSEKVLHQLGLSMALFNREQLETYGCVNFLKAGCVYSDQVNTVSPTYAQEIQTPDYGCRLEGLMLHLAEFGRLSGILNGIDSDEFNPETDPSIPAHYSCSDVAGKQVCKTGVLQELAMRPIEGAPLMGIVSRLSSQKGMDLFLDAAERLFAMNTQVIVQGLGDPWLAEQYRDLQDRFPERFRFIEKFDAPLAQRVYAGSDIFLMPSAFEPCGLGQLIAMRYGTIPVVRRTGGLADTVFEGMNGFVFEEKTTEEFLLTCARSVAAYTDKKVWGKLVKSAMTSDHSWDRSAKAYVALYDKALEDRKPVDSAKAG
jgi:starch synthase